MVGDEFFAKGAVECCYETIAIKGSDFGIKILLVRKNQQYFYGIDSIGLKSDYS